MTNILTQKGEFNYSLHGLRGLAALAVYFAHSINGYRDHIYTNNMVEPWMLHLYYLGTFGVEIFFFLSGYVIFAASLKVSTKYFTNHRFWRIYPLFIFFTILYFVLNTFIQKEPARDSLTVLISNGLFLNLFLDTPVLSPNAWTITYEVWFYIMTFALIRPIILKKHYIVSLLSIMLWSYFIWEHPISLYYVLGVLTNVIIRRFGDNLNQINKKTINLIQPIAAGITIWLASSCEYKYHWENMTQISVWALMITYSIFMLTLFHNKTVLGRILNIKPLLFLGTISYSLYLTHPYSYLIARMTTQKILMLGFPLNISTCVYISINIALTAIMVFFVFSFVEHKAYQYGTGKTLYLPKLSSKNGRQDKKYEATP